VADLAELFFLPIAAHNTGSMVHAVATAHWASTIRDFLATETVVGRGDWMDEVVIHDGPIIKQGSIKPSNRPGLGLELNPDVVNSHLAPGERYWG
jgi:L-alanine-DL-glutamate epimerase-like enolase superfamily enzyme